MRAIRLSPSRPRAGLCPPARVGASGAPPLAPATRRLARSPIPPDPQLQSHPEDHASRAAERESPEGRDFAAALDVRLAPARVVGLWFLVWFANAGTPTLNEARKQLRPRADGTR